MSVACVWSVCAPVRLNLATLSHRSMSLLIGPTPDATPLWDDVILRGLVRPAPRTDPRRNTPCGGDVILRGPCRSDSSRASPSEPLQTSSVSRTPRIRASSCPKKAGVAFGLSGSFVSWRWNTRSRGAAGPPRGVGVASASSVAGVTVGAVGVSN